MDEMSKEMIIEKIQEAETELLAAARGKIREDTWEHLCKRALEIAGEEC